MNHLLKKNTKHAINRGYTLTELLAAVAILSILASTAFPLYEGITTRTATATLIASTKHFAKECSVNTLSNDASPLRLPETITLSSTGNQCSSGATLKNTSPFDGSLITGLKCNGYTRF